MVYKGNNNNQQKKQYNPSKTNKADIENNKKALMEKFVSKTQKTTGDSDEKVEKQKVVEVIKTDDSKYKEEIQKLKNQVILEKDKRSKLLASNKKLEERMKKQSDSFDLLQKEYNDLQEKNNTLNNKVSKIDDLNKEIFDLKEEFLKKDETIEYLKDKNKRYKDEISELTTLLNEDVYVNTINQLKAVNKEREVSINYLKFQLKQSLFNNKLIAARVKISEVNSNEIVVSDEVEFIKPTIDKIKQKVKNVRFKIYNEIKGIKKKYKYKKGSKKAGKPTYGTVSKDGWFGYKFTTLEGETYKVFRESMKNKTFVEGLICFAYVNKKRDGAWIQYIYYKEEDYKKDVEKRKTISKKKVQVKTSQQKEDVDELDFKVLIITALNTKKYTEGLRSTGVKVDYFNSYYENGKRLDSIISKYDMVFYCTRHAKHYCKDVINNQQDSYDKNKYYILANDSVNNILSIIDNRINNMIVDVEEKDNE